MKISIEKILIIAAIAASYAFDARIGLCVSALLAYNLFVGIKPARGYAGLFGAFFNVATENNSFEGKGIRTLATAIPYAASIDISGSTFLRKARNHELDFALLTGALTVNVTTAANFNEGDELYMSFISDATGRTITWGTNIRAAAATLVLGVSQVGLVHAKFINSKFTIIAQVASAA